MNIYSIRDIKADYFMQPFMARNDGEATRSFAGAVNDSSNPNNMIARYPGDYELFSLGLFDEVTGHLDPKDHKSLGTGDQYVRTV